MTAPSFAATGRIPTNYQCLTTFFEITCVLVIFRDFPLTGEAEIVDFCRGSLTDIER